MTFVIDTAATVSVMGEEQYVKLLPHRKLEKSCVVLQSCSGAYLDVVEVRVNVVCNERKYSKTLVILKGREAALLGRNWIISW